MLLCEILCDCIMYIMPLFLLAQMLTTEAVKRHFQVETFHQTKYFTLISTQLTSQQGGSVKES